MTYLSKDKFLDSVNNRKYEVVSIDDFCMYIKDDKETFLMLADKDTRHEKLSGNHWKLLKGDNIKIDTCGHPNKYLNKFQTFTFWVCPDCKKEL